MMEEEIKSVLLRIDGCKKGFSNKRHIFRGCYDVYANREEYNEMAPIYNEIMNSQLTELRDLGLIINSSGEKEWIARSGKDNWTLTELGKKYLK